MKMELMRRSATALIQLHAHKVVSSKFREHVRPRFRHSQLQLRPDLELEKVESDLHDSCSSRADECGANHDAHEEDERVGESRATNDLCKDESVA